jgi:hypothetical protein
MARKKKNVTSGVLAGPEGEHTNTSIDSAENGYIVHVSGSKGGKHPSYFSKRYIAHSHPHALRLAAAHHGGTLKGGGKRSGRKKASAKG